MIARESATQSAEPGAGILPRSGCKHLGHGNRPRSGAAAHYRKRVINHGPDRVHPYNQCRPHSKQNRCKKAHNAGGNEPHNGF